jgi:hypothetical protein
MWKSKDDFHRPTVHRTVTIKVDTIVFWGTVVMFALWWWLS